MAEGCEGVSGVLVVPEKRGRRLRSRACSGRTDAWVQRVSQTVQNSVGQEGKVTFHMVSISSVSMVKTSFSCSSCSDNSSHSQTRAPSTFCRLAPMSLTAVSSPLAPSVRVIETWTSLLMRPARV
jgi:hypothetical protein